MPNAPKTHRPRHMQHKAPKPSDRMKAAPSIRGYDEDWKKVRLAALERDHWLCVPCRKKGRLTPLDAKSKAGADVDHIIPFNGKDDPLRLDLNNLQSVCRRCHNRKTAKQ